MDAPTYACVASNTPPDYIRLRVLDAEGQVYRGKVIEINTKEGWLIQYRDDPEFRGEVWPTERIEGKFTLAWEEGYTPIPTNG